MIEYDFIEQFLEAINGGMTEAEALVEVTYDQGLILKTEKIKLIEHLSGCFGPTGMNWQIPEDKFERVIFMTGWNEWVQCIACQLMQNATIFSSRERDPYSSNHGRLISHFPRTIDDMVMQSQVEALMKDTKGSERQLTMYVNVLNNRSIFAIQCLLGLSEKEVRKLLKDKRKVSMSMMHSGNGKFTKLKKLLQPYGLELRLSRKK